MTIEFGLLILGAYLLGSVPAAYLAARWSHGIDIRRYGSVNVGASNVWRLTSKWLAIVVSLFDLGKGIVMIWAAQRVGLGITEQVVVGLAAIIGHNWPVFLRFRGGRGILTTMGVVIILPVMNDLVPWEAVAALVIAVLGWFIVHNAPLGVGCAIAALPLVSLVIGKPLPMTIGFLVMFLIVVLRRLTAPRTLSTAVVPRGELLINRLLFDRDIRDRKAWVNRASPQASSVKQPRRQQEKQGKG